MDFESKYLELYEDFINGDDSVLLKIWDLVKPATMFYRIYDPHRALTKDDFNSRGLLGVFHALKTFDKEKRMKISNWIIIICNQFLMRGIDFDLSISHFSDLVRDEILINQIAQKISSQPNMEFISNEFFEKFVKEVSDRLYNINRKAYELFKIRVEHLDSDASFVMNKAGISGSYYKYMNQIRQCAIEVMNEL